MSFFRQGRESGGATPDVEKTFSWTEVQTAAYEKRADISSLADESSNPGIHTAERHFGKDVEQTSYVQLPDRYMGELDLKPRTLEVDSKVTVEGKPFYTVHRTHVEIGRQMLPKSKEFIFDDGTRQLLTAEYDEKGRGLGSVETVNGNIERRSVHAYGEDGRLMESKFKNYDDKGKLTTEVRLAVQRKGDKEVVVRTVFVNERGGGQRTEETIQNRDFYGKRPAVDYSPPSILLLARTAPGESAPRDNYSI